MKLIIAGSRDFDDWVHMADELRPYLDGGLVTEVVSGGARGADHLGEGWAKAFGIPVKRFDAQWWVYGKAAGRRRNIEMGEYGDELIAFWDGKSPGTKHMISVMEYRNKPYKVVLFTPYNYDDNRSKSRHIGV